MRKSIFTTTSVILLTAPLLSFAFAINFDDQELDLEPCINGGVSSSGLYVSQVLEDDANKTAVNNQSSSNEEDC
jgi:hypothetical protein